MRKDVLLAVAAVGLAAATGAQAEEWNHRWQVSGTAELRVDVNDGPVNIRAGSGHEIEARVTTKGWKISPSEVVITEHQSGNRVELEVRIPKHNFELFGMDNRSLQVDLVVPRELASEIHTGDGHIHASGLHGKTRFSTGDGAIEADGLDGSLDAHTGDGHMRIQGRFDLLTLNTGDGGIDADLSAGSKVTSAWKLETGDGHVTLRLPSNLAADLDARTNDGHVSIDFPNQSGGSHDENSIRARLNGGGPALVIRTGDGGIRVERM